MIITIGGSVCSGKTTLANLFFSKEKVDQKKGNLLQEIQQSDS